MEQRRGSAAGIAGAPGTWTTLHTAGAEHPSIFGSRRPQLPGPSSAGGHQARKQASGQQDTPHVKKAEAGTWQWQGSPSGSQPAVTVALQLACSAPLLPGEVARCCLLPCCMHPAPARSHASRTCTLHSCSYAGLFHSAMPQSIPQCRNASSPVLVPLDSVKAWHGRDALQHG